MKQDLLIKKRGEKVNINIYKVSPRIAFGMSCRYLHILIIFFFILNKQKQRERREKNCIGKERTGKREFFIWTKHVPWNCHVQLLCSLDARYEEAVLFF